MSDHISPLDLERFLNDKTNIIILHSLNGELWGASIAATELLGYTEEEIRQMYLANIKPKALRLSDVCKTQKSDDAPVIFQRRNGRRFSAEVSTRIIRTTLLRKTVDLVLLELELVDTSSSKDESLTQVDLQEAAEHIETLVEEIDTPMRHICDLLRAMENASPNAEQKLLIRNIKKYREEIDFINLNIADSFQIGLNMLSLEHQPFNAIELLDSFIDDWKKYSSLISLSIDRHVPEIVYGDERRLNQVLRNFTRKILGFDPRSIKIRVAVDTSNKDLESLNFDIQIVWNRQPENSSDIDSEEGAPSPSSLFCETHVYYLCKNLVRLMGGAFKVTDGAGGETTIAFNVNLPEVHDLGLRGAKKYLRDVDIYLVDELNSLIYEQLVVWGGEVVSLDTIDELSRKVSGAAPGRKSVVILNMGEGLNVDGNKLAELREIEHCKILIIRPEGRVFDGCDEIIQLASPYKPGLLGNILSQFVQSQFPYPYINSRLARTDCEVGGVTRILLVDDHEGTREIVKQNLEKGSYIVDIAVNGVDAILASAHTEYDIILMDINLPYMDGFETVTHLRKVSQSNAMTPVIMISGDINENTRLSMQELGLSEVMEKPLNLQRLEKIIVSNLDSDAEPYNESDEDQQELKKRRAQDSEQAEEEDENLVDEEILQRLIADTGKDLCREMIDMFIEESLISLGDLDKSCRSGDWEEVSSHVNDIKSSSKTFGCEALHDLAMKLGEESANSNLGESMRVASLLPEVFLRSQQRLYTLFGGENTGNSQ